MKKTQFKELLMNIKKSFVSFASIFVFILLAVSLFLGMSWGGKAIKLSADKEFQNHNFHDFEIICPYGLEEEQVEELGNIEGIDLVDGYYKTYEFFELNETHKQAMVFSITEKIDQLSQVEGEMPDAVDEIVVEKYWAHKNGVKIGDEISFDKNSSENPHALSCILDGDIASLISGYDDEDGIDNLNANTFKVVGLAETPAYISNDAVAYGVSPTNKSPVDCIMFLSEMSFDKDSYLGYSSILLRSNELNEHKYYEKAYEDKLLEIQHDVELKVNQLTTSRYEQLKAACENFKTYVPDLNVPEYYGTTLNRKQSSSISVVDQSCNGSERIRYVLSISLYFIALLICYTVISRIVFEQSPLLGTKKALGFSDREITLSYIMYAVIAAVIGLLLGILVARFIIEPFILSSIKSVLIVNASVLTFSPLETIIVSAISIVFVILVTLISCKKNLRRDALSLLTNSTQSKAKVRKFTKTKLWNKLSLFFKTIINNLFNDKKRVATTIIGIVGVTTLMVCGFNFVNNLTKSADVHYGKYQNFDTVIYFESDVSDAEFEIKSILDEEKLEYAPVASSTSTIVLENNESFFVNLFIGENESFSKMYNLPSKNGVTGSIDDGFWLCNSIAANQNVKAGDKVQFIDNTLGKKEIEVCGIVPFLLQKPVIFTGKEAYEMAFDVSIANNAFLLIAEKIDIQSLNERLNLVEGYLLTSNYKEESVTSLNNSASMFKAFAILFVFMSFTMALLVILNCLITFVSEKKKELITLMINGYEVKDAKKYIYLDTILLTIVGIILGLVLGTILGIIAVSSVCSSSILFPKTIDVISLVIGAVSTGVLMFLISLYALSKIKKFKLTDINN